jgi:hypothetical protein
MLDTTQGCGGSSIIAHRVRERIGGRGQWSPIADLKHRRGN